MTTKPDARHVEEPIEITALRYEQVTQEQVAFLNHIDALLAAKRGLAEEVDRLKGDLSNEDNPVVLWARIHRLEADQQGPNGFQTWKDAAVSERVRAEQAETRALAAQKDAERIAELSAHIQKYSSNILFNIGAEMAENPQFRPTLREAIDRAIDAAAK